MATLTKEQLTLTPQEEKRYGNIIERITAHDRNLRDALENNHYDSFLNILERKPADSEYNKDPEDLNKLWLAGVKLRNQGKLGKAITRSQQKIENAGNPFL